MSAGDGVRRLDAPIVSLPIRISYLAAANALFLALVRRLWLIFAADLALSIVLAFFPKIGGGIALSLLDLSYIPGAYLVLVWRAIESRRTFGDGLVLTFTRKMVGWQGEGGKAGVFGWVEFARATRIAGFHIVYLREAGVILMPDSALPDLDRTRLDDLLNEKALLR